MIWSTNHISAQSIPRKTAANMVMINGLSACVRCRLIIINYNPVSNSCGAKGLFIRMKNSSVERQMN